MHELNFFAENLVFDLNVEDRSNAAITDTQDLILVQANISSPAGYISCLLLLGISAFFPPLLVILHLIISLDSRQFLLDETKLLGCCMGAIPEFSTQIKPTNYLIKPTSYLIYRCPSRHLPVTTGQINLFSRMLM